MTPEAKPSNANFQPTVESSFLITVTPSCRSHRLIVVLELVPGSEYSTGLSPKFAATTRRSDAVDQTPTSRLRKTEGVNDADELNMMSVISGKDRARADALDLTFGGVGSIQGTIPYRKVSQTQRAMNKNSTSGTMIDAKQSLH